MSHPFLFSTPPCMRLAWKGVSKKHPEQIPVHTRIGSRRRVVVIDRHLFLGDVSPISSEVSRLNERSVRLYPDPPPGTATPRRADRPLLPSRRHIGEVGSKIPQSMTRERSLKICFESTSRLFKTHVVRCTKNCGHAFELEKTHSTSKERFFSRPGL